MSDVTTVTALTNMKPNSCVPVTCDCPTMWSFVQEQCYLRMTNSTGDFKSAMVKDYETRARRIAGTYARFYLEQEDHGDPKKKGRFYWMALAAFASKTVACTFKDWRVKAQGMATSTTKEGLGKGNFWLFCDIAGWHWYYSRFGSTFEMCRDSRNTNSLDTDVKKQTKAMPWQAEALPKIKNLAVSKEVKLGFEKVKEFEGEAETGQRRKIQMAHLLVIADHEQGVILQPLIYDDKDFAYWVQVQRSAWVNWAAPGLELVFNSACAIDDEKLKSVAPKGTKLEEFRSRMDWIRKAADQFHELMQKRTAYMEGQISTIAGWYNMPDKK